MIFLFILIINYDFRQKLVLLSHQIGTARVILRLFDDLPMLYFTLSYGYGPKVRLNKYFILYIFLSNYHEKLSYMLPTYVNTLAFKWHVCFVIEIVSRSLSDILRDVKQKKNLVFHMILRWNIYIFQDSNKKDKIIQVLSNILNQLYFPVEHFAFFKDINILSGNSKRLWVWCVFIWTSSLILSLIR